MSEFWIAAAVGAASGGALLAAIRRMSERSLTDYGFLIFAMMLAIYLGARLVTGTMSDVLVEFVVVNIVLVAVRVATDRWPPAIGVAILIHGVYDALLGPATGVAAWYPPLCAGFDLVVGAGLVAMFRARM